MDKLFEEIKIKMVMRLRKVTREEAQKLIAAKTSSAQIAPSANEESSGNMSHLCTERGEVDMISAEEFFSEL